MDRVVEGVNKVFTIVIKIIIIDHKRYTMSDTAWTAVEAKLRFSELLDSAAHGPQVILRHGKPAGVVIAWETYNKRAQALRPGIQVYLDELAEINSRLSEDMDLAPRSDRLDTGALFQ